MMTLNAALPLAPTSTAPDPRYPHAEQWLLWSLEEPRESPRLSVAEMAECRCPDLCDRDHQNE